MAGFNLFNFDWNFGDFWWHWIGNQGHVCQLYSAQLIKRSSNQSVDFDRPGKAFKIVTR